MVNINGGCRDQENVFGSPTPAPTRSDATAGTKQYFNSSSGDDDGDDSDDNGPPTTKKLRPTVGALVLWCQRIVEHRKVHVRVSIATKEPFAAGMVLDRILTASWLAGHKDVKDDLQIDAALLPTEGELTVVSHLFILGDTQMKSFAFSLSKCCPSTAG